MAVDLDVAGVIRGGTLTLATAWVRQHTPLAFDIAKSFIRTFAPEPDGEHYEPIVRALRQLQHSEGKPPEGLTQDALRVVHVFVGGHEHATVRADFSRLEISNIDNFGEPSIELSISLS